MPSFLWTQKQDVGASSRVSHGLTYDAERNRVLLFGGDPGGPPLADTWSWDGNLWTQVADTGPSARWGLAMSLAAAPDASRKLVVLFGGASGSNLFADTWTWDGTEWTQIADTGPTARRAHALAYDSARNRVVLFGGSTAANPAVGDTWEWDGTEWTQVQDVGPSARRAHAMAFDPTASRVVLFGGGNANGAGLGDTWLWDGTDWTQAADTGPDPRAQSAMVAAATIVLFGGANSIDPNLPTANRIMYGDSWRWDGKDWTKVQDIGPSPRWGHGMAFRSDTNRIVLFGGSSVFGPPEDGSLQAGVMGDTWEHSEAAAGGGGGGIPQVQSVTCPPLVSAGGPFGVSVTLTAPAPAGGVNLVVSIADNAGQPIDPTWFSFPVSLQVPAGSAGPANFNVICRAGVPPADYFLGVAVSGGVQQTARFRVQ
jgi:hypothetical protein